MSERTGWDSARRNIRDVTASMIVPVLEERTNTIEELQRLLADDKFRTEQKQIKHSIAMGYDLSELQYSLGITDKKRWRFHIMALGIMTYDPATVMIHYRQRSKARYAMFMDLMQRAKDAKDRKTEHNCILAMCKLDAAEVQLAQALGLIKLTTQEGEDGVTGHDPSEYERRVRELEAEIQSRIEDIRAAQPPITIDVQPEPNPRREADSMGSSTVSQSST